MPNHSGRFVLRLSPELHARAARAAREAGISLNEYCRNAVERFTAGAAPVPSALHDAARFVDEARTIVGDDLRGVVLFGSYARGESRTTSDIDLLIVIADARRLERELYRLWDLRTTSARVSPHFCHLPRTPLEAGSLWYETALDGIIHYDRDGDVHAFLSTTRRAMADGRLRRRYAHGHPYWVKEEVEAYAE